MKQKISILGCGWLGLPLASELAIKDYEVKGSTTSITKLDNLKSKGIAPFLVDLSKRDDELTDFLSSEVLIIAVPSKNVSDFESLISKIEKSEVKKVVFISSTSVYPNINGIVTEESTVKETPLSEIESLFKSNSNFKTTIIRFGGLMGYDRKPGSFIKAGKLIENPEGYINMIHRDDCIGVIEHVIEQDVWNETLNACADTHPKRRAFYTKEMAKVGKTPVFNENSLNEYKIISPEKLKTILEYKFKYSDLMKY